MAKKYHLQELSIALDSTDERHILPGPISSGGNVLDVGCGAGQTLIAKHPDHVTYGVDSDISALSLGRTLTHNVRFVCAKAEALPFPDSTFSFVISRVTLPYTNIPHSLTEIRRVMKAGGFLWITLHSLGLTWRLFSLEATPLDRRLYVLVNGLLFHSLGRSVCYKGKYGSFQTNYGIRRALERSGFCDIVITRTRHFLVTATAA